MKRGWIAVGMIALSLLLGGAEYFYVTSNADVCLRLLDEANEKIAHNEFLEAESVAKRLEHRFQNGSAMFNVFMYHSEVGHIAADLARLSRYARAGDASEFSATCACARCEIQAIRDAKQLKWENLF